MVTSTASLISSCYAAQAGFEGFSSHACGSILVFSARKEPAEDTNCRCATGAKGALNR